MPNLNSILIKEPIKKFFLTINFDENDDIYNCIKQEMLSNSLNKCVIEDFSGKLKNATINCFSENNFKKIDFFEKEIANASGELKINNKELFGSIKILTKERKPVQGTLVKGIADNNLIIRLSFFE